MRRLQHTRLHRALETEIEDRRQFAATALGRLPIRSCAGTRSRSQNTLGTECPIGELHSNATLAEL
jgi:hypothetical protein